MKKLLLVVILGAVLFSCNNKVEEKNKAEVKETNADFNDLLPQDVIVYNEVNFTEHELSDWVEGVDSLYMTQLNDKVLNSDVNLFSSNIYYEPETEIAMTDKDVRDNMSASGKINSLYFIEKWSFNKSTYSFNKEVVSWSPVYEYYKEVNGKIDSSRKVKKLLYDLTGKFTGNEKLIAENITYEVSFDTDRKTNEFFDLSKFSKLIIDPVIKGEKKAVEFFDKTNLSIDELKQTFGYRVDSMEVYNEETDKYSWETRTTEISYADVKAFIFVEDWYIDTKTFAIKKKVKSIAPVLVTAKIDEDGDLFEVKRIAFVVNL